MSKTHRSAKTLYVSTGNDRYAYRQFGHPQGTPLLFLIHFRGTMDYWDPLLVNAVAKQRPVILFDSAGVGQSTGSVPTTIREMARHAITFLSLLKVSRVDVIGFSMGGYVAPLVHLDGPAGLVRKLIIAGSGVSFGEDMAQHTPEQQGQVGKLVGAAIVGYDEGFDKLFFFPSTSSQAAGKSWYQRIHERDISTSGEERSKLVSHGYADGGEGLKNMSAALQAWQNPDNRTDGSYDRLESISVPVLIAQGKDDFMIPTVNSFVMQQKIKDAKLIVYPDSGHGFLYQHAEEFAEDLRRFLDHDA